MPYQQLNSNIQAKAEADHMTQGRRQRLIRYALDNGLLPAEAQNAFQAVTANHPDKVSFLSGIPWFTALYWVRRFFETGNGNNFRQQILHNWKLTANELNTLQDSIFDNCGFPDPGGRPRQRFLAECFAIAGGQDGEGQTSEIWRSVLAPLSRHIRPHAGDDENWALLHGFAADEALPLYARWLIDTGDPDFLAVLKALATGNHNEEAWLQRVIGCACAQAQEASSSATASWCLYKNGNISGLRVEIRNIKVRGEPEARCEIKQGRQTLSRLLYGAPRMAFTLQDLAEEDLRIWESLKVYVGGHHVTTLQLGGMNPQTPTLFRFAQAGGSCSYRQISSEDADNPEHISALSLLALLPPAENAQNARFTFGSQPARAIQFCAIELPGEHCVRNVVRLDLDAWDGAPRQLRWGDQTLAHVGARPYLEVQNASTDIQTADGISSAVVFDTGAVVRVRNLPDGQPVQWEVDGTACGNQDSQIAVGGAPGQQVRVVCRTAGRKLEIGLIFIPPQLEARVRQTQPAAWEAWRWQPEAASNARRVAAADQGRQEGLLTNGTSALQLSAPLSVPFWYWTQGWGGQPDGSNNAKEFNSWSEADQWSFHLYMPANDDRAPQLTLRQQGHAPVELPRLAAGFSGRLNLHYLCQPHLNFGNLAQAPVASVCLGDTVVANILNQPANYPVVVRNLAGDPSVFFPLACNPANYAILRLRESRLVDAGVECILCNDFPNHQLVSIPPGLPHRDGEGVWLVLLEIQTQTPQNLYQLAWQLREAGQASVRFLTVSTPGMTPLRGRLTDWHPNLTEDQIGTARHCLECLSASLPALQDGPFADAIQNRELLGITPQWWDDHFQEFCGLDQLQDTLGRVLRTGYNWCAEPKWLSSAYRMVRRKLQAQNLNWIQGRRNRLVKICPAIAFQIPIECGYPLMTDPGAVTQDAALRIRDWEWNVPLLDPIFTVRNGAWAFLLTTPNMPNGTGIHGFLPNGINLAGFGGIARPVAFHYHGVSRVRTGHGFEVFQVILDDETRFLRHVVDQITGDADSLLINATDQQRLSTIFTEALCAAVEVVGSQDPEGRGLARMFKISSDQFSQMADEDETQRNRATIFQAAVVCRLHSWLGYAQAAYPPGWPLLNTANYRLVCAIVSRAWENEIWRKALMTDLVPVEWFIAWFHS
jgi:hypothetical protein